MPDSLERELKKLNRLVQMLKYSPADLSFELQDFSDRLGRETHSEQERDKKGLRDLLEITAVFAKLARACRRSSAADRSSGDPR